VRLSGEELALLGVVAFAAGILLLLLLTGGGS
jgi:hypothetical protein